MWIVRNKFPRIISTLYINSKDPETKSCVLYCLSVIMTTFTMSGGNALEMQKTLNIC